MINNQNRRFWLVTLMAGWLAAGCSDPVIPAVQPPLVDVYIMPVKNEQNLQKFPAVIQASDLTSFGFRVNGELTQIAVISGQKVNKGDLIARVDPTNFELDVKDKQAKVTLAKITMERFRKMVALGNMAKSSLDLAEAEFRISQAQYEYALVKLKYVELKAPFDGIIASVPADNYQNTAVGQVVVTLHRIDQLEVKVDLPDELLAQASANKADRSTLQLDVSLDAYPGHIFKGTYKEHTTEQSNESKTYTLILEIAIDPQRIALPGMPGSVQIDLAKIKSKGAVTKVPLAAIVFPDSYLITSPEKIIWRIKKDSTVEPVRVTTGGLTDSAHIEVFGDINSGDVIVVSGLMYLKAGIEVNIRQNSGDLL